MFSTSLLPHLHPAVSWEVEQLLHVSQAYPDCVT